MRAPAVPLAFALPFALLAAAFAASPAPVDDPLKSAACAEALERLQAAPRTDAAGVEAARQAAARACFGGMAAAPTGRPAQAPLVVPPPRIAPPAVPPLPPPVRPVPPQVDIGRAPGPAQCTPAGCWVNDGTHLRHVPAVPGALCQAQGGVVYCP